MERNSRVTAPQDSGRPVREPFSLHSWQSLHPALPRHDLPPFPEPLGRFWSNQPLALSKKGLGTPASQSSTRETRLAEEDRDTRCSLPFQSPTVLCTSSQSGSVGPRLTPLNADNSLDEVINGPSKDLSTSLKTRRKLQRPRWPAEGETQESLNWIQDARSEDLSDLVASPDVSLQDSLVFGDSSQSFRLRARTAASRLLTPAASELQKAIDALEEQAALNLKQLEKALDGLLEELRAEHGVLLQQTLRDLSLLTPRKERKGSWTDVFVCSKKPRKDSTAGQQTSSAFLSYLSASTAATANDLRKSHLFLQAYQVAADLVFGSVAPSEGCARTPASAPAPPGHDTADAVGRMRLFYLHRRLSRDFDLADFGGLDVLSLLSVGRLVVRSHTGFSELWSALQGRACGGEPLAFLLEFARLFYPAYSRSGTPALVGPLAEGLGHYWHHFETSLWVYLRDAPRGTKPTRCLDLLPSAIEAALRRSFVRKEPLTSSERTAILQTLQ